MSDKYKEVENQGWKLTVQTGWPPDCIYVYSPNKAKSITTKTINIGGKIINVDLDEAGKFVGLEIL